MSFAPSRPESAKNKITIIRDDVVDPGPFLHHFPHITFFNDRGFSRSRAPVRASTSSICIQSCAYFNVFAASWRCESFKKSSSGTTLSTLILGFSRSHFPGSRATPRHSVLPRFIRSRTPNTIYEKCCSSYHFPSRDVWA